MKQSGDILNVLTGRIRLDFRSDEPIYGQIVRQIEGLVVDGTLTPGDQLPTVRELAIDLRINFSTVARAYRILDEKRLISTQRGRGTYIWDEGAQNVAQAAVEERGVEDSVPDLRLPLDALARRFIEDAAQQGFTLSEIRKAVDREANNWEKTPANTP
jgi:GntR family transcriptional regulator